MRLPKQLAKLEPIVVNPPSSQELLLQLLKERNDDYYNDQGRLLHGLGMLPSQYRIITLASGLNDDAVINKLSKLVANEAGVTLLTEKNDGWNLQLKGREGSQNIGRIPIVFTHNRGMHNAPEFMTKVANYLEDVLPGSLYVGYWKDTDTAITCPFAFALVYVPDRKESVLKALDNIEWNRLGKKSSVTTGSITATNTLMSYYKRTTWFTPVVLCALIIAVGFALNNLFRFDDLFVPWKPLFIGTIVFLFLGYLDYLNRKSSISFQGDELVITGGVIPLFPGYERKRLKRDQIIKVWIKVESSSAGTTDGPVIDSTDYDVYITTSKPSEKRLIPHMEKNEAELIKSRIEKWMNEG